MADRSVDSALHVRQDAVRPVVLSFRPDLDSNQDPLVPEFSGPGFLSQRVCQLPTADLKQRKRQDLNLRSRVVRD